MIETAILILYGVLEYRRREKSHRLLLARLEAGETVTDEPAAPTPGGLIALTVATVVLVGAVTTMILCSPSIHHYGASLRVVALILGLPLLALVPMVIRAFSAYANAKEEK